MTFFPVGSVCGQAVMALKNIGQRHGAQFLHDAPACRVPNIPYATLGKVVVLDFRERYPPLYGDDNVCQRYFNGISGQHMPTGNASEASNKSLGLQTPHDFLDEMF